MLTPINDFASLVISFSGCFVFFSLCLGVLFAVRSLGLFDIHDGWYQAIGVILFALITIIPHGWHIVFAPPGLDFRGAGGGVINHAALFAADFFGALAALVGGFCLLLSSSLKRSW